MSGLPTSIDDTYGRRRFIKQVAGLCGMPALSALHTSCGNHKHRISGSIIGANATTGHMLRSGNFPAATARWQTDVLIIGGGITGLSAKRWLNKNGSPGVMMLEMDNRVGGNSVSDVNAVSAYPWGAHYLPIPDVADTDLIAFLQEAGVIQSFDHDGLPFYNDYYLCHDPEERLYINGYWQEGLVPHVGITSEDRKQIADFFKEVEALKTAKGNDGKPCFSIPLDTSSTDEQYRSLDGIPFAQYLEGKGYSSPYLLWYLEYCCKDDYGATLAQTSAWAGLHYFASRRGKAANAASSAVLTWPEGNAFLAKALTAGNEENIKTGILAYKLIPTNTGVDVLCYDTHSKTSILISAKRALVATPQFITSRLSDRPGGNPAPSYSPWVVANVTFKNLPHTKGFPLCWDNVIYGQESVGYVYANHQELRKKTEGVITCYRPITTPDTATARAILHRSSYKELQERVISDLSFAHPGIAQFITNIDIWVWGHGMILPAPGYIWGPERQKAMQPIDDKIFFAHSDLSGISIFEEAFYQGITAARKISATL
ncbi:MAG: NAD(P)-binding protein [Bacteroidota bacterium]